MNILITPKIHQFSLTKKVHSNPVFTSNSKTDFFEKNTGYSHHQREIEAFAEDFIHLINNSKCTKDNLQSLMRAYIPRTKLNEQEKFSGNTVATYNMKHNISKSNYKLHNSEKKINVNLKDNKKSPMFLFDMVTHEMIHNFQEWENVKFQNDLYNKNFDKNEKTIKTFKNTVNNAVYDTEKLIKDFSVNIYNIPFAFPKLNITINKLTPKSYNENEKLRYKKVYYSIIKNTLQQEHEAYSTTNKLDKKYFNRTDISNSTETFTCAYLIKRVDYKLKNIDKKLKNTPPQTLITS